MANVICASPLHDSRTGEADYEDPIATGGAGLGMLCPACARLDYTENLQVLKNAKIKAIDARTDQLIAAGFTFASKQFSLTLSSQSKMIGTHQVKDNPSLTYPIRWNTIDDEDYLDIIDAATLDGFYLTGLGTIRAHLDSGTSLKDQVRAAATVDDVLAVVDTR